MNELEKLAQEIVNTGSVAHSLSMEALKRYMTDWADRLTELGKTNSLAPTWLPIETDPKSEGSQVLIYCNGEITIATTIEINSGDFFYQDAAGYIYDPSHWMPLPEPPK